MKFDLFNHSYGKELSQVSIRLLSLQLRVFGSRKEWYR